MNDHKFQSIQDARRFVLAGDAIVTLQSLKSGRHFTYNVQESKPNPDFPNAARIHFVKLLSDGSADDGTFRYLGLINEHGQFRLTRRSSAGPDAPSVRAFSFFMSLQQLHPDLVIRHTGKCGRCGKTLTVPESIDSGLGPVCRAEMSHAA
jgi:hypothetical protein